MENWAKLKEMTGKVNEREPLLRFEPLICNRPDLNVVLSSGKRS